MRTVNLLAALLLAGTASQAETHKVATWSGILLDGGCVDRSVANLRSQPEQTLATTNTPQKTAQGIQVSPQVMKAERAEATLPQTPDHASRFQTASCALTSDTKAFLLLLSDGTVLTLDEGGNTLAFDAFQNSAAGQAILNGKVGGLKPQATVVGVRLGDKIRARSVELRQPSKTAPAK